MGLFDGFAEGLTSAIDDVRHNVVEQGWFGQQTTGNIELPQAEAPAIEPANTGIIDLTSPTTDPSWGVSASAIEAQATSFADIVAQAQEQQPDPPQSAQEMER